LGLDQYAARFAREPWLFHPDQGTELALYHPATFIPDAHPHDFLIPWVAKELGQLRKAVLKNEATGEDYAHAVTELEKKSPAIAMWATENRINLTKTSLAEALEAVKDFEVETGDDVPQGHVVYSFDDGYTIQRLTTQAELDAEGEAMQHCVAGYCEAVTRNETVIFSLRDRHGRPHATIEWVPRSRAAWSNLLLAWKDDTARWTDADDEASLDLEKNLSAYGRFVQIRGKQNEKPAAKYLPYMQAFISERFGGDPLGLLMVATPGQTIVFAGHTVYDVDFTEDFAWSGVKLEQADFRDATFVRIQFDRLHDVKFDGSRLSACNFGRLFRCSFKKTQIGGVRDRDFFTGKVDATDFRGATFDRGARFSHSDVTECDFRGTIWRGEAGAHETRFIGTDLSESRWEDADFREVAFRDCVMDGLTIDASTELSYIVIVDTDMRQMDPASALRLWDALGNEYNVKWPQAMKALIVAETTEARARIGLPVEAVEDYGDSDLSDTGDDA
jgi:hypothetical protein